jgi:hypothetical protein
MSKLRERIAANRVTRERSMVAVDEWGEDGKPLAIYAGAITGHDVDRMVRKHPNFLSSPSMEAMSDMIIHKAEDENGEKLFTLEDKQPMLGEPFELIATVFGSIFVAASVEEQGKN